MHRTLLPLALAGGLLLAFAAAAPAVARAADHRDGPGVQADPSTDLADLYAWMSSDGHKVNLALTVGPGAAAGSRFSNAALYVFHIASGRTLSDAAAIRRTVICQFDAQQAISCWGPEGSNLTVTGDASGSSGIADPGSRMRVFAGLRADSFFWNQTGFRAAAAAGRNAIGQAPAGCPVALQGAAPQLVQLLASNGAGMPGDDSFAKGGDAAGGGYSGNVLALVVTLDASLVTDATHPVLGAWASTNKRR